MGMGLSKTARAPALSISSRIPLSVMPVMKMILTSGMTHAHLVHEFHTGHAGQFVIGNEQVDGVACGFEKRLFAGWRLEHLDIPILQGIQCGAYQTQNIAMVINEQNIPVHKCLFFDSNCIFLHRIGLKWIKYSSCHQINAL
jgi:hypothetical protein